MKICSRASVAWCYTIYCSHYFMDKQKKAIIFNVISLTNLIYISRYYFNIYLFQINSPLQISRNINHMGNQFQRVPQQTSNSVKQLYKTYRQSFKITHKKYRNLSVKRLSMQNKDQLINSLFQSFYYVRKYTWARQLYPLFRAYFFQGFQKIWLDNRQQFYQNLALMSQQTGMMNSQIKEQVKNKLTFETFFFDQGPGKRKSANSIINKQIKLMQSIHAINSSVAQNGQDFFPDSSKLSIIGHNALQMQPAKKFQSEFHPSNIYESSQDLDRKHLHQSQFKFNRQNVQKSSIIIPQTVFVDRLDQQQKNQISEFLNFYRVFSNSIQQVINSNSLVSCPLKHFQITIKDKLNKKKISKKNGSSRVLFDTKQSKNLRIKRHHNNNLLLFEVRDFTQAYSQFIWKYLNLSKLQETYIGALITMDTVYNIVLKSVWTVCGWIGLRGFEWQQSKLPLILDRIDNKQIPTSKKLITQGQELSKQTNPIYYFKKIVLLYRQTSRVCPNADKLLDHLQSIIVEVIKSNKHCGFLRMHNIIEKLIKMDETNGQISYAWTSWCILIQMLKSKLEELAAQKALQNEYLIIDK